MIIKNITGSNQMSEVIDKEKKKHYNRFPQYDDLQNSPSKKKKGLYHTDG
jgi:hypothetical protein